MGLVQTIAPQSSGEITRVEQVEVRVKRTWESGWESAPYLYPVSSLCQTFPGIGRAQFEYDYGYLARPDQSSFSRYRPLDLAGYFAQIVVVGWGGEEVLWVGILDIDSEQVDGSVHGASGRQVLQGFELGHLLDRVTLTKCWAYDPRLTAVVNVGSLPDFNHKGLVGLQTLGNRSTGKAVHPETGGTSYVFGGSATWSNLDILEYLLTWHSAGPFTWVLSGQYGVLSQISEIHRFEGMTLWHALGDLIDRRRGLGWRVIPSESGVLILHVFSVLGDPICFGDVTIPGNPDRIPNLRLDTDVTIDGCLMHNSEATVFDEIEVIGEPITTCFTVSFADGSLERGWTESEFQAYVDLNELGSNCADATLNDQVRAQDKYKVVFQKYRISPFWNGLQVSSYGSFPVFPVCLTNGTIDPTVSAGFIRNFKSLERHLPFTKPATIAGAEPEHQEPLVFFTLSPTSGGSYLIQADTPGDAKCSVRMADGELGLMVEGKINHVLAKGIFLPQEGYSTATKIEPLVDYRSMYATVAVKTDENLRVVVQARPVQDGQMPRRLTIKTDGDLWYVAPGTVTGLLPVYVPPPDPNDIILHPGYWTMTLNRVAGGVVYDDSPRLRQIGLMAAAWYGQSRLALQVGWQKLTVPAPLGAYLDSVSTAGRRLAAGTVVTAIEHDYLKCRTELRTSYLDLDFLTSVSKGDRKFSFFDKRLRKLERRGANLVDRSGGGGGGTQIYKNGDWLAWAEGD
jgi:hypothetical protein